METSRELIEMEKELRRSPNSWRWLAAVEMDSIPSGRLATYGYITSTVANRYGVQVSPRNVAWLRKYLYGILTHDTEVPLHRIAKVGDVGSLADSEETRGYNKLKRKQEGSLGSPKWLR